MSFAISAIYKGQELYIASDTMMSSKSGCIAHQNAPKFLEISKTSCVGITGDFGFGRDLINVQMPRLEVAASIEDMEQIIIKCLPGQENEYKSAYGLHSSLSNTRTQRPRCVFLLAYKSNDSVNISFIDLVNGKTSVLHRDQAILAGHYLFFFAPPPDMTVDQCYQICRKIFLNSKYAPNAALQEAIKVVSKESQYVNDIASIWKAADK